jgi:two-component system response regulator RegA
MMPSEPARPHGAARHRRRLLIVDDDRSLLRALEGALREELGEIRCCASAACASQALSGWVPELLVLDVALPDGTAFDVLERVAACRPAPTVVAISGAATAAESFRLAQLGVRVYLAKPFSTDELRRALARAASEPADIRPLVRDLVGKRPLREVERDVRATMVAEALDRSAGSRGGAGRLLRVSRQLVQHILRGLRS